MFYSESYFSIDTSIPQITKENEDIKIDCLTDAEKEIFLQSKFSS